MQQSDAAVSAVLATLIRATVDGSAAVVLRTRHIAQARELAAWLERAHGTRRTVVASPTQRGVIEVRLPPRIVWPPLPGAAITGHGPLASLRPVDHLCPVTSPSSTTGRP